MKRMMNAMSEKIIAHTTRIAVASIGKSARSISSRPIGSAHPTSGMWPPFGGEILNHLPMLRKHVIVSTTHENPTCTRTPLTRTRIVNALARISSSFLRDSRSEWRRCPFSPCPVLCRFSPWCFFSVPSAAASLLTFDDSGTETVTPAVVPSSVGAAADASASASLPPPQKEDAQRTRRIVAITRAKASDGRRPTHSARVRTYATTSWPQVIQCWSCRSRKVSMNACDSADGPAPPSHRQLAFGGTQSSCPAARQRTHDPRQPRSHGTGCHGTPVIRIPCHSGEAALTLCSRPLCCEMKRVPTIVHWMSSYVSAPCHRSL